MNSLIQTPVKIDIVQREVSYAYFSKCHVENTLAFKLRLLSDSNRNCAFSDFLASRTKEKNPAKPIIGAICKKQNEQL